MFKKMTNKNCIFCKIVKKEIPAHVVYEDENFLAFLDIHPQSPGHTQVITKMHYRWVWDVPNAGKYFEVVKKIAIYNKKHLELTSYLLKSSVMKWNMLIFGYFQTPVFRVIPK